MFVVVVVVICMTIKMELIKNLNGPSIICLFVGLFGK